MSTALPATEAVHGEPPDGRPAYWRLFRGVALALFPGAILLWLLLVALSLLGLLRAGTGGASFSEFAPWVIDGPWPLAAALGWGTLVAALFAAPVRAGIRERDGVRLSRTLTMACVALGGYAPWIVTSNQTARIVLALLATTALLRAVAFDRAGAARVLPQLAEPTPWRLVVLLLVCALALVAPYAVLHPLSVTTGTTLFTGSGTTAGSSSGWLAVARPGKRVSAAALIRAGRFPITVTAVAPLANGAAVRVVGVTIGRDAPRRPADLSDALPLHLAAGHSLWTTYTATLTRCPSTKSDGVTRIRVSYRELGLSLTQTLPLYGANMLLACFG